MKRSEVVFKLQQFIRENNDALDRGDLGFILVSKLEELGMAPPEVAEPVETHYLDAMGRVVRGEDSKVYVRKWEAE